MKSSLKIGRIRGIEIGIHPTWLIAFVFIAWTLRSSFYPDAFRGWTPAQYWAAGILTSLALFLSVLIHELAHSITAQKLGMHVQGIVLFIFGGVSQIAGTYNRARDEFLVAFAGPASSLLLGGLFLLLWNILRPERGTDPGVLVGIVSYLGLINIALGIFNLLPGFPLDGGRVLRSIVWGWTGSEHRGMRVAVFVGRLVAWGLIAYGGWQFYQGDFVSGLWLAFIGLFISAAGRSEDQYDRARERVGHVSLRAAVHHTPQFVDASTRVSDVMEGIIGRGFQQIVPVTDNGEPAGFFVAEDAYRFPAVDWHNLSVGSVIVRRPLWTVQLTDDAVEVLEEMDRRRQEFATVLAGDALIGVVDRPALEAAIRFADSAGGGASVGESQP